MFIKSFILVLVIILFVALLAATVYYYQLSELFREAAKEFSFKYSKLQYEVKVLKRRCEELEQLSEE